MLLVPVFCGIDWAEDHYDLALVDQAGVVLTERRINDDSIGYQLLLALLAEHGDDQVEPIPVAIETPRGLVVACLRRTGRQVYAINPLSVARYRERHRVARTKSDRVDAQLLANILRTDRAAHRPLPADSELAQAVAVLARAQQDAVWNRHSCRLRCGEPADSVESQPPAFGFRPSSAAPACISCYWLGTRWVASRWPCSSNSRPLFKRPMTSPRQPDSSSSNIRRWPSSPASLDWASCPRHVCWPRSAMTPLALPTPAGSRHMLAPPRSHVLAGSGSVVLHRKVKNQRLAS